MKVKDKQIEFAKKIGGLVHRRTINEENLNVFVKIISNYLSFTTETV